MTSIIPHNRNLGINPEFNEFVTNCTNTLERALTNKEYEFIKKGYRINTISGIAFAYNDFAYLNQNHFRQMIHLLKPIILKKYGGRPSYYQFEGLYLDEKLTEKYTAIPVNHRLFANLEIILSTMKHYPAAIHDLRIEATVSGLYEKLIAVGKMPNKQNKTITLHIGQLIPNIDIKVNVYTTGTITVMFGCTFNPLLYSEEGFLVLSSHLGSVKTYLEQECHGTFEIQPVLDWRIRMFHFNKDSIEYNFPTRDYTLNVVFNHIRIYNKKITDSTSVIRIEKQITPNTTLGEEYDKIEFRLASELM